MATPDIGRIGIWSMELRFGDPEAIAAAAAEVDALGFGAIWVPGGIGGDITGDLDRLLAATQNCVIATGILNIWKHEPGEIASWWQGLRDDHRNRLMLGLGVSHGPLIGEAWAKPLLAMRQWLDGAEAAGLPADHLCLAALGPGMLKLAGERTAGAHPYLVTPEHSAEARAILGPGALLAPEQGVVLESDPAKARALARAALTNYLHLPNYVNSWMRLGFTQDDVDSVSEPLVDALFAWGTAETIAGRVRAHLDAGASHVCVQAIQGAGENHRLAAALPQWRELAKALL